MKFIRARQESKGTEKERADAQHSSSTRYTDCTSLLRRLQANRGSTGMLLTTCVLCAYPRVHILLLLQTHAVLCGTGTE